VGVGGVCCVGGNAATTEEDRKQVWKKLRSRPMQIGGGLVHGGRGKKPGPAQIKGGEEASIMTWA